MLVEIIDLETAPDGDTAVQASCDLGSFAARWHGAPPALGAHLHVELGLDHRFTWGLDAVSVEEHPHAIASADDGGVTLWATIEQLDDGGFVGLRLGPSVLMAEADGDAPPIGSLVRLDAPAITLFDTNI